MDKIRAKLDDYLRAIIFAAANGGITAEIAENHFAMDRLDFEKLPEMADLLDCSFIAKADGHFLFSLPSQLTALIDDACPNCGQRPVK
jgi:hypothetical protein